MTIYNVVQDERGRVAKGGVWVVEARSKHKTGGAEV
jgi:hypothetical protein